VGGDEGPAEIRSPLPGKVIAVHAQPGDVVGAGAPLATIEAMKMEHVVAAPGPATVEAVLVHAGDQVARGRPLVRLLAAPGAGTDR
jgi:acetyl-CoA/propionyl-CoA carboxylase biotin carboxyl carrier protein